MYYITIPEDITVFMYIYESIVSMYYERTAEPLKDLTLFMKEKQKAMLIEREVVAKWERQV